MSPLPSVGDEDLGRKFVVLGTDHLSEGTLLAINREYGVHSPLFPPENIGVF